MRRNTEDAQHLLDSSSEIKDQAKLFEKQSLDMKDTVKKTGWWMCSKPCVIIFGSIGAVIILTILLIIIIS